MRLKELLEQIDFSPEFTKESLVQTITQAIDSVGYGLFEVDDQRPWGVFFRLKNENADEFVKEFFPGLDPVEARLGRKDAGLSPKILLVSPSQRLSWQYHDRRAERWAFLSEGGYHKSMDDNQGAVIEAADGDIVQFQKGERHRLVGSPSSYTVVAEIWQHVDPDHPSEEDDIIRLADDYQR